MSKTTYTMFIVVDGVKYTASGSTFAEVRKQLDAKYAEAKAKKGGKR